MTASGLADGTAVFFY